MYLLTINITKNVKNIKVIDLIKPQFGEVHDYQLNPADLITLQKSDIFIVNGGGIESFLSKVMTQLPKLKIITASQGIPLLKNIYYDKAQAKNVLNVNELYNPHVWVSVSLAIQEVKNIGEQLAEFDPMHAAEYKKNTDEYIQKLEQLKTRMHVILDNVKNRNIITFHDAFQYFAKEFNLNIIAVIEKAPGSEPSAGELVDTINVIKKHNIKAIFAEPQYPAKSAFTIAAETGVKVYMLNPLETGTAHPEADDYINIMENNLQVLKEALQ